MILSNGTDLIIKPGDLTYIPYTEILQRMTNELSDRMFGLEIILFLYVLINIFVFNDGARFRKLFDKYDTEEYMIDGMCTLKELIYQVVKVAALFSAIMLVFLNIIYRTGWNI